MAEDDAKKRAERKKEILEAAKKKSDTPPRDYVLGSTGSAKKDES
ncbi:MAG: hypothetical protein R3B92_02375 [Patescibacteria group bacterium]